MLLDARAPDRPLHVAIRDDAATTATGATLETGTTDGHWQPTRSNASSGSSRDKATTAPTDVAGASAPSPATGRPPRPAFFSVGCGKSLASTLLLYCAALALAALLAHGQRHLVRTL